MRKLGSLILASAFLLPILALAQTVTPEDVINQVDFVVFPQTPGPNQRVTVSIEAYGFDLNSSQISWSLNGSPIGSGKGLKQVTFTAGANGSRSDVSVSINTAAGVITHSISITPGSVDLLWQGNTYAPPFYKGRTLWTRQSGLTIVAIPNILVGGAATNPNSLVYTWKKNDTVLGASSGAGKSSLHINDTVLSIPVSVRVDVSDGSGPSLGAASLSMSPGNAGVLVYEDNPLYGLLLNREVASGVTLSEPEVTFSAIPLFMSQPLRSNPALSYSWSLNGTPSQTGNRVTYRAPAGVSDHSSIQVEVNNTSTLTQAGSKNFLVQFGNQQNSL